MSLTKEEVFIWVFKGNGKTHLPSAIFSSKEKAEKWININKLSGVLTKYPVDIPLFDWVIKNDFFTPKNDLQKNAKSIGNFNSAYLEHYHYEKGY